MENGKSNVKNLRNRRSISIGFWITLYVVIKPFLTTALVFLYTTFHLGVINIVLGYFVWFDSKVWLDLLGNYAGVVVLC